MAIYAVKTDRMDISLELSSAYIFVQQKWKYKWLLHPDYPELSDWTIQEKRDFHNKSDELIWKLWSSKAYAFMTGKSPMAMRYRKTKFKINLDIRWVIGYETAHWNVNVFKIPKGMIEGSSMIWATRQINLDSQDIIARPESDMKKQIPVAHEFGHTSGNTIAIHGGHGDEYKSISPYLSDKYSIMNVGTEVRIRHFDYLEQQLNRLVPSVSFDISL